MIVPPMLSVGSSVGEEDLRFPASGINPLGAASDPARSLSNGLLYFSGSADNVVAGAAQMPHAWAQGTPITPHLHLVFPTSAAANTRWKLEYTIANIGATAVFDGDLPTADNAATIYAHSDTITTANPQAVRRHVYAEFSEIAMTGLEVSSAILWRLSRLAASDGADTDVSAVVLVEFDIHYRSVRHGKTL